MNLTEKQLRKLIREELSSGVHPAGTRTLDVSALEEEIQNIAHKASSILKDGLGLEIDDSEWNTMNVPNRITNKLSVFLRKELLELDKEWKAKWQSDPTKKMTA